MVLLFSPASNPASCPVHFCPGLAPYLPPQRWSVLLENSVVYGIDKVFVEQICSFTTAGYKPSSFCAFIKLDCVSVQKETHGDSHVPHIFIDLKISVGESSEQECKS